MLFSRQGGNAAGPTARGVQCCSTLSKPPPCFFHVVNPCILPVSLAGRHANVHGWLLGLRQGEVMCC